MTEHQMREEIRRLAPFHHNVELPYNLSTFVPELAQRPGLERSRLRRLVNHAFPALLEACGGSLKGRRVLDIACNCGGFSFEAAKRGSAFVLGIDLVDHYIEQANFIKRALSMDRVEFDTMGIDDLDESRVGSFDVTFCFGILYHLEDPVGSMRRVSSVTREMMLVDTDVLPPPRANPRWFGKPLWLMNSPSVSAAESKSHTTSLWRFDDRVVQFRPNEAAVVELLKFLGFPRVEKIAPGREEPKRYREGKRATFLARRS